jgi:hypothetical protein
MPWSSTSDLRRELVEPPCRASQASIVLGVMVSSCMGPNVGKSRVRTIEA